MQRGDVRIVSAWGVAAFRLQNERSGLEYVTGNPLCEYMQTHS
jgi:hypothetical protein